MADGAARFWQALLGIGAVGATGALIFWALRPAPSGRAATPRPRPPTSPPLPSVPVLAPLPTMPTPSTTVLPPPIAAWQPSLAPGCAAHRIQLPYALKWLDMESGGNPCAIGHPAAHGPDGNPLEMGVAQFYNPDDLKRLGLTGAELRAYCVPGDQHDVIYKGKHIKGFSQALARPLTAAEMQRQADGTIGLIAAAMISAMHDLTAVHAGTSWSPGMINYWTLVKLQHGLPVLSREGLPAVTAYLGHPPFSWREFRATLDKVKLSPEVERKYRSEFPRILDNAERCASAFVEAGVV